MLIRNTIKTYYNNYNFYNELTREFWNNESCLQSFSFGYFKLDKRYTLA